jgi:hypothetical protein
LFEFGGIRLDISDRLLLGPISNYKKETYATGTELLSMLSFFPAIEPLASFSFCFSGGESSVLLLFLESFLGVLADPLDDASFLED